MLIHEANGELAGDDTLARVLRRRLQYLDDLGNG
jgi:hypothetical protein